MRFLKDKKVLVTGAAGLVGTNALIRLKSVPGVCVNAAYHLKEPKIFSDNISYTKADLTNFEDCKRVVEGIDYVMMFAARIARRSADLGYLIPNLTMNLRMLEAAYRAGVKKFLWLSSATAYPPKDTPSREEEMFDADPHDANFPVGWTARYVETLCRMYATKLEREMAAIVLRPTAIYGKYGDFEFSTSHVLPALIRKVAERHSPLEIWGDGEAKRDFIYVGDVVEACLLALEKIDGFAEFNIGSGKPCSVKELLSVILDVDNYSNAEVVFERSKPVNAPLISVDCAKAKRLIGFEAGTSLREGVARTIEWFKKTNSR